MPLPLPLWLTVTISAGNKKSPPLLKINGNAPKNRGVSSPVRSVTRDPLHPDTGRSPGLSITTCIRLPGFPVAYVYADSAVTVTSSHRTCTCFPLGCGPFIRRAEPCIVSFNYLLIYHKGRSASMSYNCSDNGAPVWYNDRDSSIWITDQ